MKEPQGKYGPGAQQRDTAGRAADDTFTST